MASAVPIPMVFASFSFAPFRSPLFAHVDLVRMFSLDDVLQWRAWRHQRLLPPCTAIRSFLRSGVVAR